jgi:hypothetical protein
MAGWSSNPLCLDSGRLGYDSQLGQWLFCSKHSSFSSVSASNCCCNTLNKTTTAHST